MKTRQKTYSKYVVVGVVRVYRNRIVFFFRLHECCNQQRRSTAMCLVPQYLSSWKYEDKMKGHLETKYSKMKNKLQVYFRRKLRIQQKSFVSTSTVIQSPLSNLSIVIWDRTKQAAAHDRWNCNTVCCDRLGTIFGENVVSSFVM
jgi:hypothetical protein